MKMVMKRMILSARALAIVAMACHGANAAYSEYIGEKPVPSWDKLDEAFQKSIIEGVRLHSENPNLGSEEAHKSWMDAKLKDGWVFGEEKDAEKKTHPCLVPYGELPKEQQFKDALFRAVVLSLAPSLVDYDPDAAPVVDPRIAELENALAKAKADNDNAAQKIAKLEAGIAPAADPVPEIEIKRPKVGAQLKMPKKQRDADKVVEALNDGDLFQVVLADAGSQVLPAVNFVGGQSILAASGDGDDIRLTLIEPIEIDSSNPHASIREAWLLDVNGIALSKCRLAVDLVGGGGLTAAIPAKSIVFNFEQPAD